MTAVMSVLSMLPRTRWLFMPSARTRTPPATSSWLDQVTKNGRRWPNWSGAAMNGADPVPAAPSTGVPFGRASGSDSGIAAPGAAAKRWGARRPRPSSSAKGRR